jgi:hypothetical protein
VQQREGGESISACSLVLGRNPGDTVAHFTHAIEYEKKAMHSV